MTYDKAECEPGVTLDNMGREVAAVVTPAGDAFIAFHLLAKGMLATGEDKTHVGGPLLMRLGECRVERKNMSLWTAKGNGMSGLRMRVSGEADRR